MRLGRKSADSPLFSQTSIESPGSSPRKRWRRSSPRFQLMHGGSILFAAGSTQDQDNSEQVIAELDQGGLGLPDRDYYTNDDAKSKETRERYLQHIQKVFELMGDSSDAAKRNAKTVMLMETALAKASLTRVERRDPYKLKHKMEVTELKQLAPNFDWQIYYSESKYPEFKILNVDTPDFFKEVNARLAAEPIENWKIYLRYHVVDSSSPIFPRISCKRISTSTASIFAEQKRCSRAGSVACGTPITIC